jgi:hypothetical protein
MATYVITYHHVQPVERRVDDEHKRIQDNLVTAKLRGKIYHEHPIQSKGHRNEANRQIADFLRGCQERDNQDKEQ